MLFRRPDCRPRWRLNDAYHNINLVPLPWAASSSSPLYLRGFSLDLNFGKQLNRWYLHRRLFYLWNLKPAGPNSCHFICFVDNLREMHVKIPLKNKFAFNLCCWNSIPHLRTSLQGSIFSHFDGFEKKSSTRTGPLQCNCKRLSQKSSDNKKPISKPTHTHFLRAF